VKEFDDLLSKDLPKLNEQLKAKGQSPLAPAGDAGGTNAS
jgi:hypothetical protein